MGSLRSVEERGEGQPMSGKKRLSCVGSSTLLRPWAHHRTGFLIDYMQLQGWWWPADMCARHAQGSTNRSAYFPRGLWYSPYDGALAVDATEGARHVSLSVRSRLYESKGIHLQMSFSWAVMPACA